MWRARRSCGDAIHPHIPLYTGDVGVYVDTTVYSTEDSCRGYGARQQRRRG